MGVEWIRRGAETEPVRAVLFDFDGTLSTLRHGWEEVMRPMMCEMLSPRGEDADGALRREVDAYIDASTGIQTIRQMRWLADEVKKRGRDDLSEDPWWYKAEYNRRLMERVGLRLRALRDGTVRREAFLVAGAEEFLRALRDRGVRLFVASGTDRDDVAREAEALGLAGYFEEVAGALPGDDSCSKEAVLAALAEREGFQGSEVAVAGDGKVEIALGRARGMRTLGVASDEERTLGVASDKERGAGVDPRKRRRLLAAGADAVTGDFLCRDELLGWLCPGAGPLG